MTSSDFGGTNAIQYVENWQGTTGTGLNASLIYQYNNMWTEVIVLKYQTLFL